VINIVKIVMLLLIVGLFSNQSKGGAVFDLTNPDHLKLADMYPNYKEMRVASFDDTKGIKELGDGNRSIVGLKPNNSDDWEIFQATLSTDTTGKRRVYIHSTNPCKNEDEDGKTVTLKTNEQNVRYVRYCDGNFYYFSPISTAGLNFLVSEFKKKEAVKVEFSDIHIIFIATGFTKSWNNFGGDAL